MAACADEAKNAHTGDHDIALSFDEWGVWYSDVWNQQEAEWKAQSGKDLHHESWPKAPRLLEDIYNAADAVVEGSLMITLLKHCDRVRSASRAQLVNVIAPIMAKRTVPHGVKLSSIRLPKPHNTPMALPTVQSSTLPT